MTMAPDPAIFLRGVMAELGCETDADLVAVMGWRASATSNISKWRRGRNAPDFAATWEMLAAAGWLDGGAIRRRLSEEEGAEVQAGLAQAEARARDQAERQERARDKRRSA
jgi:hypothetical protein